MLKNYVSELDLFLQDFDKTAGAHSEARTQEEAKHRRIADARDYAEAKDEILSGTV
ncbi:MAG: hypothetical protein KBD23_03985 [Gammaproteobacteria bacterium]|nr:hypothetical protein [Gammaproteobacteria bacterium]